MDLQSRMRLGAGVAAALLCGFLTTSTVHTDAFAQGKAPAAKKMSDKEKRAAARKHYSEGKAKMDAKDYEGAVEAFRAADELIPAPQAKEKIAICLDKMGKTSEAIAAYETFISAAPADMSDEVEAAKKRIEDLKAPGPIKVISEPPNASVEVDGEAQMGVTPLDVELPPGTHKIKVSAPGYLPMEKTVEVQAGTKLPDLTFTLVQEPMETAPLPAPTEAPPPPPTEPEAERSNVPAYVTLGVAGASAIVGTVFGVKALGDKSDFDDNPTVEKADDAERNALIADMAFGVAITLGVTGVVLLVSNPDEPEQVARVLPKRSWDLTPVVGSKGGGAAATWRF